MSFRETLREFVGAPARAPAQFSPGTPNLDCRDVPSLVAPRLWLCGMEPAEDFPYMHSMGVRLIVKMNASAGTDQFEALRSSDGNKFISAAIESAEEFRQALTAEPQAKSAKKPKSTLPAKCTTDNAAPCLFVRNVAAADDCNYDMPVHFDELFGLIDIVRSLPPGKSGNSNSVLVHCAAGISRSATIVVAYLMWKTHTDDAVAIQHVLSRRGVINPNPGFRNQLRLWHDTHFTPLADAASVLEVAMRMKHLPIAEQLGVLETIVRVQLSNLDAVPSHLCGGEYCGFGPLVSHLVEAAPNTQQINCGHHRPVCDVLHSLHL